MMTLAGSPDYLNIRQSRKTTRSGIRRRARRHAAVGGGADR
jgi:hypothetical protein